MTRRTIIGILAVLATTSVAGTAALALAGPGHRAGVMKRFVSATIDDALEQAKVTPERGIEARHRERVLAPFVRLDVARTPRAPDGPPQGVGLGLTLARRVAEVHGGSIAITPAEETDGRERGCRVTLTIPRDASD